jgi:Spy/CpxP family protein refolding chaperone
MKFSTLTAAVAAATLLIVSQVSAQDAPANGGAPAQGQNQGGGGRGNRGNRGGGNGPGGGNFDPAQFQQRMNDLLKASLKASDEEWSVIQPLLEKVQTKQREARAGGGGGAFGRRGGGGPGGGQPGGAPGNSGNNQPGGNRGNRGGGTPESDALSAALQVESTSPEEIKTKLAALRDARKKAQGELEQARAELSKVLTVKQEAALVLSGVLE